MLNLDTIILYIDNFYVIFKYKFNFIYILMLYLNINLILSIYGKLCKLEYFELYILITLLYSIIQCLNYIE